MNPNEPPQQILHRSVNRVITAGDSKLYKPSDLDDPRGWRSPDNEPYRPIGTF